MLKDQAILALPDELGCKMTDFERKSGDKKNINSTGSDPMLELTRLLGRNNLSSGQQSYSSSSNESVEQDQWRNEGADFNPYNSNTYSPSEYNNGVNSTYAEDNSPVYPGQENAYWSDEGDDSSTAFYDARGAADSPYYSNDLASDQQQSSDFYDEPNYVGNNSQNYGWSETGGQSAPSQQGYDYNVSSEQDGRQEPSFYDVDAYSSQAYVASSDINVNADAYSQDYQGGNVADETQYWTDVSSDLSPHVGEPVEGQQWTQSLDEVEQFANEYGIEPNEGVYRSNPNPHFSYNEPDESDVLPGNDQRANDGGIQNDSSYIAGPQFVDDLSQGQTNLTQPIDAVGAVGFSERDDQAYEVLDFELGRPLGAVVAPIRMATKPQSFLGYGQAVAVLPSRSDVKDSLRQTNSSNAKTGFALSRANSVEASKSNDKTGIVGSSAPIGRGINPFTTAKVEQSASKSSANSDFEDALNDFNLTIKGDGKKRYKRDPNLKTVRPDQNAVPETQNFDLPRVSYGDVGQLDKPHDPLDQEFSDVLATGLHDTTMSSYNDPIYGASSSPVAVVNAQDPLFAGVAKPQDASLPFENATADANKYDWGASESVVNNTSKKAGGVKKIVLLFALLAIILAAVGVYYTFFIGSDGPSQPVVIQRDEGEVRVAPESDSSASDPKPDQTVYNRVEDGATTAVRQSELVDKSETPVDLDKVDEQAPHANEASLEPNSIEAHVLRAAENSLSVHEVPTVTIRDSENVSGDEIKSIIANERDDVLVPGQIFREHLQTQNTKSQPLPSGELQSDLPNNGADGDSNNAATSSGNNGAVQQNTGLVPSTSGGVSSGNGSGQNVAINNNDQTDAGQTDAGLAALSANNNGVSSNHLGETPVSSGSNTLSNNVVDANPIQPSNQGGLTSAPVTSQGQAVQAGVTNPPAGAYYVQIASQPSREAAQQSLADIKRQSQANSIIGNRQVVIVAADIPGRGTYYRVRVVADSQAAANQVCEQLKGLQVSCFVGK